MDRGNGGEQEVTNLNQITCYTAFCSKCDREIAGNHSGHMEGQPEKNWQDPMLPRGGKTQPMMTWAFTLAEAVIKHLPINPLSISWCCCKTPANQPPTIHCLKFGFHPVQVKCRVPGLSRTWRVIISDHQQCLLATLWKIANKYKKPKDQLAVVQEWFNISHFLQLFSPILNHTKIAGSQALLHIAQWLVGRRVSVSHPLTSSCNLWPKRAWDKGKNKRSTNGSKNMQVYIHHFFFIYLY